MDLSTTTDVSRLPLDFDGSLDPNQLPEISLCNPSSLTMNGQTSPMLNRSGGDRPSPVRGRTMKEYDQQISDLKKENFSLKMRIYYMEERMQQRFGAGQDVFKTNIELQVEIQNLRQDLIDKQMLVQKAALAMETLTTKHEQEDFVHKQLLEDYSREISHLRGQLGQACQNCGASQKNAAEAERQIASLKQQLEETRFELEETQKTNKELSSKIEVLEGNNQDLHNRLKWTEQMKEQLESDNADLTQRLRDLNEELQDAHKKVGRKDRDMENLVSLLHDQSHVDCASILEPQHLQDELDDQRDELGRKDGKILDLDKQLRDKEATIGGLQEAIERLEDKYKDSEKVVQEKEAEVKRLDTQIARYKSSVTGLLKAQRAKDKECNGLKKSLDEAVDKIRQLLESLREAELQKVQALSSMSEQLAEAEADNRRLNHQLAEASQTSENLVKSLGKKEGELAGFQDKLGKAIEALSMSEEAVEALHAQLKVERAEFDNKLREQALHFQVSVTTNKSEVSYENEGTLGQQIVDLQKLIASQNVELMTLSREKDLAGDVRDKLARKDAEIELMRAEYKREMSELEKELQSLKAAVNSKDLTIQSMETYKALLEEQQRETVQRLRESWSRVGEITLQDLSLDLFHDMKMMMNLLRGEISSLATLQLHLKEMDKSEHGLPTEILTTEVTLVQKIYRQLEEGLERNSRLHQTLLNSLSREHRQSDSPDSNSCQDGGYNLVSSHHRSKPTSASSSPERRQNDSRRSSNQKLTKPAADVFPSESLSSLDSVWSCPPANPSVGVEACQELMDKSQQTGNSFTNMDKSLQTGASFTHIDQWVQTSPRVSTRADESFPRFKDGRGRQVDQEVQDGLSKQASVGSTGWKKLSYLSCDEAVEYPYVLGHHNDSLTDDAKEEHLGLFSEGLEDYSNFQHGVLVDELCMNSYKRLPGPVNRCDSRRASSPGRSVLPHCSKIAPVFEGHKSIDGVYCLPKSSTASDKIWGNEETDIFDDDNVCDVDEPDGSFTLSVRNKSGGGSNVSGNSIYQDLLKQRQKNTVKEPSLHVDEAVGMQFGDVPGSVGGHHNELLHSLSDNCSSASTTDLLINLSQDKPGGRSQNTSGLGVRGDSRSEVSDKKWAGHRQSGDRESLDFLERVAGRRSSWAEELEQYRVASCMEGQKKMTDESNESVYEQEKLQADFYSSSGQKLDHNLNSLAQHPSITGLSSEAKSSATYPQGYKLNTSAENEGQNKLLGNFNHTGALKKNEPVVQMTDSPVSGHKSGGDCTHNHSQNSRLLQSSQSSRCPAAADASTSGRKLDRGSHTPLRLMGRSDSHTARRTSISGRHEQIITNRRRTLSLSDQRMSDINVSRLNKSYDQEKEDTLSGWEVAGTSQVQLMRSSSESHLDLLARNAGSWLPCAEAQSSWTSDLVNDCHQRVDPLFKSNSEGMGSDLSYYPDIVESMEKPRSRFHGSSQFGNEFYHSPAASLMATQSVTSVDSSTTNVGGGPSVVDEPHTKQSDAYLATLRRTMIPLNNLSRSNGPAVVTSSESARSENLQTLNLKNHGSLLVDSKITNDNNASDLFSKTDTFKVCQNESGNVSGNSNNHGSPGSSAAADHSIDRVGVDSSVLDQTAFPDMTYSSMLDGTLINRLMSSLAQNLSMVKEDGQLSVEQLQVRLEHLERVNLTLRQEIGVYEAIHRSQGIQVSAPFGAEFGCGTHEDGTGFSEDDLLKQHLIEIRKLRQRLERLDITNDPDQLLIFQSHTQQRLIRQETMITHLQQQMLEKEEHWQRERTELLHKLTREKSLLVDKLEAKIAELQKIIKDQTGKIEEQDRQLIDLLHELSEKETCEEQKEEEIRKVNREKEELEESLMKRQQEFLDIEKKVFRLEMARESSESECKRLLVEMREKEQDHQRLKKHLEEFKESSKSAREEVAKCQRTLQEKVVTIHKITEDKAVVELKMADKDGQIKRLEMEIDKVKADANLARELELECERLRSEVDRNSKLELEFEQLKVEVDMMKEELESKAELEAEVRAMKEELKRKETLETRYKFQKVGYEAEIERITEEMGLLRSQLESENVKQSGMRHTIERLEQKLEEKNGLERKLLALKEEVRCLSELPVEVDRLNQELDSRVASLAELKEQIESLRHIQPELVALKEKLSSSEEKSRGTEEEKKRMQSDLKQREEENKKVLSDLKEREEKLKKRDKQLHHLLGQVRKLDAAFTKQKYLLNEKQELIQSLKKQMHLYEITLTSASKEEKDSTMKQLLKELIATQRQVEELLSRLEQNPATTKTATGFMDHFSMTSSTSSSTTSTLTTVVSRGRQYEGPDKCDNVPDVLLDEFFGRHPQRNQDEERRQYLDTTSSTSSSPQHSHLSSQSTTPGHSPAHQKYFAETSCSASQVNIPPAFMGTKSGSLFAVLQLEAHEKLRKEADEGLIILSGVEARINSRLKMLRAKPVAESLEYSTLREVSMSCHNLQVCLKESCRLLAAAWVTELPPLDAQGHFYDPLLLEQNENLRKELDQMLDPSLRPQSSQQLNITGESDRPWETSLYRQLHKTAKDLEQVKENIDTSLAKIPSPVKYMDTSLSKTRSPVKYMDTSLSKTRSPVKYIDTSLTRTASPTKFQRLSQHRSPRRRLEESLVDCTWEDNKLQ